MTSPGPRKRLLVHCDGTWMNSDTGYTKGTLFKPHGTLQVPSNVTRLSRCFKHQCTDGTLQIITYESGVGTGSNTLDSVFGGAFGVGLSERVRESYSFICANYCDGDEIVLIGFSRGAFTVRSVAGMIAQLGLLTREGMEHFYPIFKDMENWMNKGYHDEFPTLPFPDKPKGINAEIKYRERLEELGYTRVRQDRGAGGLIKVKAVAVWDTVGSLGIPKVSWLERIGITPSNEEYQFYDTSLSDRIEHAFHALALDETRPPFSPAVWERLPDNKLTTDLRQVWFPGNHGNCGGGWPDQGSSDITLAWMIDQLASVGCEFDEKALEKVIGRTQQYYKSLEQEKKKKALAWAMDPIFGDNHPLRPWGLAAIEKVNSAFYTLAGKTVRTPGLYKQVDAKTKVAKDKFLQDTNERIHSSVRVRLVLKGLGLNDQDLWNCEALKDWELSRTTEKFTDPIPRYPAWQPHPSIQAEVEDPNETPGGRWVWTYCGDPKHAPPQTVIVEEPLGPYERHVLKIAGGTPSSYDFAKDKPTPKRA